MQVYRTIQRVYLLGKPRYKGASPEPIREFDIYVTADEQINLLLEKEVKIVGLGARRESTIHAEPIIGVITSSDAINHMEAGVKTLIKERAVTHLNELKSDSPAFDNDVIALTNAISLFKLSF